MRAIKLRIYPTIEQRRQLQTEFDCRRYAWNWTLVQKRDAWKSQNVSLSIVDLSRMLTSWKASTPFLKQASATVLNNTLWDLDAAFSKFFKKQAKYPKFKKPGAVNSVCYTLDKRRGQSVFRDGELLKLPKLGLVNVVWSREVTVFPNTATVSRTPDGKWFVSLQIDHADHINPPATDKQVGIDVGLTCFAALSNGTKIYSPKPLKQSLRRLAHAQRALSRKKRGSSNSRKAKSRVARIHARIARQRANFLHGVSTSIVREHKVIAIEDLNVRGIMANGKLARAASDAAWGELRRQLTYKSKWYGRELSLKPRFERSTGVCPDTLIVGDKLPLHVRTWSCSCCGVERDRDIASAQVIVRTVRSTGTDACGGRNKPDDSQVIGDNTALNEAGKAQKIGAHGCAQAA